MPWQYPVPLPVHHFAGVVPGSVGISVSSCISTSMESTIMESSNTIITNITDFTFDFITLMMMTTLPDRHGPNENDDRLISHSKGFQSYNFLVLLAYLLPITVHLFLSYVFVPLLPLIRIMLLYFLYYPIFLIFILSSIFYIFIS